MSLGLYQIHTLLCAVQVTTCYPGWLGVLGGEHSCSQLGFRKVSPDPNLTQRKPILLLRAKLQMEMNLTLCITSTMTKTHDSLLDELPL